MYKRSKKIMAMVMSAAMVLSMTAVTRAEAADKKDNIEIRLASRWGGEEPLSVYFQQKIEEFNALDNGITIVGDHVTDEQQYLDKLSAQIGSGTQPEIFIEYGGTRIQDYVESGILLDLKPYLDADPEWRDSFLPLFDKWEFDDGVYGVPVMLYAIVLYSNTDVLKANGLEVPQTFEDLEKCCETLKANGINPFMLGEQSNFRAGHFLNNIALKTYGPDVVTKLADRTMPYDGEEMLGLYQTIKDFNDKGYFGDNAVGVDNNGEKAAFLSGESAFRYDGAWFVSEVNGSAVDGKVQVSAFPSINEEYKNVFQGGAGQGFSVTDTGDKEKNDAAIEVVKYLTSQDYYRGLEKASNGGIYPVKFESDPDTVIDDLTKQVKEVIEPATDYRDDMQNYDPETHMLNTVRTALQGLFVGNTPEQCGEEIVNAEEITEPQ
ncbi:ABC transporter substrate-binding protein [Murimonas intestini]|uniref:ABC-type glycerol-3-phosphate transport system substrate-binding protein n=1 Tax=Murimonas intestini TaxID=1337051 RepID=A0AB73SY05_9FIRM|nr:extracellular solute-binding protein [Murimonas intestini]MCR1843141.1 extracellular solute-binding protein [Murimonas intestini]MCR1868450.1 extracellular solute-binding protein [Murimonas intestini]MCR1885894.1 extracellular solute-binding protein [Murimonas intestini]